MGGHRIGCGARRGGGWGERAVVSKGEVMSRGGRETYWGVGSRDGPWRRGRGDNGVWGN